MKTRCVWILGCGLVVAIAGTAALAQQPAFNGQYRVGQPPNILWELDAGRETQPGQLAKQFVKSDKEEEKKAIRQKMMDQLNSQFDQHVQQQQKELEELEKQIASLRTVLKKRVEAKAAIIDRRFEQLVQDAQGLGWNVPSAPRANQPPAGGVPVPALAPAAKR